MQRKNRSSKGKDNFFISLKNKHILITAGNRGGKKMDKLAKNQFILLLIRTILLQGTKLVFLLSLGIAAFHGWQYLGSTIYFSVKDTKGNLTKPEMFSHAFPTISMIFFLGIFAYMISLKINNDEAFDVLIEKTSKKMFSLYMIGGLIGLGTLPGNQFGQQMETIVIAMIMYLFIRRIVELENEKLRKSIFPLYKTNGAFEETAWRLNSEWYRYLKPVRLKCEKKETEQQFLPDVGSEWGGEVTQKQLLVVYRIRYTPFYFKVNQEQLFPQAVAQTSVFRDGVRK